MGSLNVERFAKALLTYRWPLIILFGLLLIGLVILALINWRKHHRQRKEDIRNYSLRIQLQHELKRTAENYQQAAKATRVELRNYVPTKGDEKQYPALQSQPNPSFQDFIDRGLSKYAPLLASRRAPRMISVGHGISKELDLQQKSVEQFLPRFSKEYDQLRKAFYGQVSVLSQLHDEIARFGQSGQLKKEVQEWVKMYRLIFQDWAKRGADKSIEPVVKLLVQPILRLNEMHPSCPLVHKTTPRANQAELIYTEIQRLDQEWQRQAKHYAWSQRRCHRILKKMSVLDSTICPPRGWRKPAHDAHLTAAGSPWSPLPLPEQTITEPSTRARTNFKASNTVPTQNAPTLIPKSKPRIKLPYWLLPVVITATIFGMLIWILGQTSLSSTNPVSADTEEPSFHTGHSISLPDSSSQLYSFKEHATHHVDTSQSTTLPDSTDAPISTDNKLPRYGIDVSHHQETIDWPSVAADSSSGHRVQFAIMKAGQGVKIDSRFNENWANARSAGLTIGAYQYFSFKTSPENQAQFFINTVELNNGDLRPIVDVESDSSDDPLSTGGLSKEQLNDRLKRFLDLIEDHYGVRPIIYSGHYFYSNILAGNYPAYDFWLAEYKKSAQTATQMSEILTTSSGESALMWQFSASGSIEGIEGEVDLDYVAENSWSRLIINE